MSHVNPFSAEYFIGTINSVKVGSFTFSINDEAMRCGRVQVGQYCLVRVHDVALFGLLSAVNQNSAGSIGSLELIASIELISRRITSGISRQPPIGSEVFIAQPELVQVVIEEQSKDKHGELHLNLGRLPYNENTTLKFTPERVYGRHCAVIGTSGSGKSWSLAKIMQETSRLNSKLILFDATGEYHSLKYISE
jgi:uncharacterized protein